MPDLSLQGLASFAQIPQQMAINYLSPDITRANLVSEQLKNQVLTNQMPYVAPQASANVGLTSAQSALAQQQAALAQTEAQNYIQKLNAQILAGAAKNPMVAGIIAGKIASGKPVTVSDFSGSGQPSGDTSPPSISGGSPAQGMSSVVPGAKSTPSYVTISAGNGIQPGYMLGQDESKMPIATNAAQFAKGPPPMPQDMGQSFGTDQNAPNAPIGTYHTVTVGSPEDLMNKVNAYISKTAAPEYAFKRFTDASRAWESFQQFENQIAQTPGIDKYQGYLGQTEYQIKDHAPQLLRDPQFLALKQFYDIKLPQLGSQLNQFFTGSHAENLVNSSIADLEKAFDGKASKNSMYGSIDVLKNTLLAEMQSVANQSAQQSSFSQITGLDPNINVANNPVLPKFATQDDFNAYISSMTPQRRAAYHTQLDYEIKKRQQTQG